MKFLDCGKKPLGLYAIVNRATMLKDLYESGVNTAQLRIKDLEGKELENEIIKAINISNKYKARIFINDYWKLAIKHKAYGIHLGQEDIKIANIKAIYDSNIRLGISTHTNKEIKIALDIEPSYIAIGPIFETQTKKMPYKSLGIKKLKEYSKVVDAPIVAIAGIKLNNIKEVLDTKVVNGVAVLSGFLKDGKVCIKTTKAYVKAFNDNYYE